MKEATVILGNGPLNLTPEGIKKLEQRIKDNQLLVEFGTPSLFGNQTIQQRLDRHTSINEQNVCAQITKIEYDPTTGLLKGVVVPYGPKKKLIKQLIERDQADRMTLSIRGQSTNAGVEIMTFDLTKF